MASLPPAPNLAKTTALSKAQATVTRLATLVPSLTTVLSPVTVYQPGGSVGGELVTSTGGLGVPGTTNVANFYGVWVAPDITGTGAEYTVQVECFGAGGGGGGGSSSTGGGGGGGGEYACEDQYPVTPGNSYAYVVGLPGTGGINNTSGPDMTPAGPTGAAATAGGRTIFDIAGLGLATGVVANGGLGGDSTSIGIGGDGGAGSPNTISFPGGGGGTNSSGHGADNPASFAASPSGFFTLSQGNIKAWYILDDDSSGSMNESFGGRTAAVTSYTGGLSPGSLIAPNQVPAYASPADPPELPNAGLAGACAQFQLGSNTSASARIAAPTFAFAGSHLTLSCWLQCDPSGTWGNPAANANATVAANSLYYATFGNFNGYGLFFRNTGTVVNPSWSLYFNVGNGGAIANVHTSMPPVPGTWYYVVVTFNSGALTMYVNGASVATASAGFSSVTGGAYNTALGLNPGSVSNWFFGYMSNVWFAQDTATSTLVTQAFGLTPPTGGAGGGASGGPSATGGDGDAGSGSVGGVGGTPATQPANLASVTTAAMAGFAGSNAGATNVSPSPVSGTYGGGGGGAGDKVAAPLLNVVTVPFTSALTYYGADASSGAGSQYNTGQQSNPNSALNTVLYAGGAAGDSATGSKISVLLLPQGLAAQLNPGLWTIDQVFLTFTNAYPTNPKESVLEVYHTNDTSLPSTYQAAYSGNNVASIPVPAGAGTITYDITESGIGGNRAGTQGGLQTGSVTALLLGPNSTPTIDAYNAPTGADFYSSVYGPGAADTFGNSQAPYLTIVLIETTAVQVGSNGAGGGIVITVAESASTPVGMVAPYATTDDSGNQFAQGYTGPATAFDPSSNTPGSFQPETWHKVTTFNGHWTGSGNGVNGFWYRKNSDGLCEAVFDLHNTVDSVGTGATIIASAVIPSAYYPAVNANAGPCCLYGTLPGTPGGGAYLSVTSAGAVLYENSGASAQTGLALAGHVRWWPGSLT